MAKSYIILPRYENQKFYIAMSTGVTQISPVLHEFIGVYVCMYPSMEFYHMFRFV